MKDPDHKDKFPVWGKIAIGGISIALIARVAYQVTQSLQSLPAGFSSDHYPDFLGGDASAFNAQEAYKEQYVVDEEPIS